MFRIAVKASAILTLLTILLFDVFCVPIGSKRTPPGQIAKLCDEWLTKLDISVWTKVSIPSDLAARIISLYLETDHQLLGTFDPHQFVSNLVNHGDRYYSTFLPNTLLYWGSVRLDEGLTSKPISELIRCSKRIAPSTREPTNILSHHARKQNGFGPREGIKI